MTFLGGGGWANVIGMAIYGVGLRVGGWDNGGRGSGRGGGLGVVGVAVNQGDLVLGGLAVGGGGGGKWGMEEGDPDTGRGGGWGCGVGWVG